MRGEGARTLRAHVTAGRSQFKTTVIGASTSSSGVRLNRKRCPSLVTTMVAAFDEESADAGVEERVWGPGCEPRIVRDDIQAMNLPSAAR